MTDTCRSNRSASDKGEDKQEWRVSKNEEDGSKTFIWNINSFINTAGGRSYFILHMHHCDGVGDPD